MKREDLKKILGDGATDEVIDQIMAAHGKDIEGHKNKLEAANGELTTLKGQLADASKQIESFKDMKSSEDVEKAINEYKTAAEQAQKDAAAQVAKLKFDHALAGQLSSAKVRNVKAVLPLLDMEALQKGYNEKDDSFLGLDKQLEALKQSDVYLFAEDEKTPRLVTGGNNSTVLNDPVVAAARQAAGLVKAEK